MSLELNTCVVRILDPEETTVGTGFVATESGLVVTCAHVIEDAQVEPGNTVDIVLHATGERRRALVEKDWWRESAREDVSVLRLHGPLPQEIAPIPLGYLYPDKAPVLNTFGFPAVGKSEEGLNGRCEVVGSTTEGGSPVLQLRGTEVTGGFSGAPVLDPDSKKVVGVVTSITEPDMYSRQGETAFAIPSDTLVKICPDLEVPNVRLLLDALSRRRHLGDLFVNLAAQSQSNQRQTHGTSIVEDLGLSDSFREMEGISAEPLRVEEAVTSLQSDVMEELRHHTRCVLLGGAGAGKTTVIEKLALDSAKKRLQNTRGPIPVFLRLSLWTDQVSAMEFVRTHWPLASDPDTAIPRGDAVVFLDALNEVGASAVEKSKMLREWIDSPEGPKSIYVTCRTDDYVLSELDLGVPVIELQEMDEARIKELATQYFERYGEDSGPFLSQILPSSENRTGLLYGLAQNPYMLTAMIVSYLTDLKSSSTSTANLPQNLGLLSKKLINSLWTWEGERRSKGWLSYDEMERQFSRLAFNMIDNNQPTSVPLDYAYEYCQPELLRVAKSAHIVESDDDNVRFYHQLMQEYFAAVQLKKMGVSTRLQAPTLESGERRATAWDQVIIAMCGFVNDPDKVVTQILMNDDPYLAAMCIASGVDVGQNTIDNTVGGLLAAMDGWWNIGGRLDVASKALEQIGQPAVPALRQALKDKDTSTRLKTNVVRTLGRIGDSSIIPDLQELLREIDDTKPITLPTKALHNAFKYADTGLTIAQFVPGQIGQAARQIKSKMNPHARFQIAQAKRQDVKDVEIKRRKALRAEVVHALNKLEATD